MICADAEFRGRLERHSDGSARVVASCSWQALACARCDVDSPASLAAALQEGWVALCRDDGIGWNYLGICPECQAQENAAANQEVSQAEDQKRLFA